nr:hypothetical protein [Candidatus Sigynarchaeota archaeon]
MKRIEKISMNEGWTVSHPTRDISLVVDVPSTIFESLIKHGTIEDPFHGSNEKDMEWVYESDWTYTKHFEAGDTLLGRKKVTLRFHGLDTIADVHVNGEKAGHVENMFMVHDFDVTGRLKRGDNEIKVEFRSPTRVARDLTKIHKFKLRQLMSLPGIPYLRKAQYSFGWDWGPKLPDIGIWQPVELVCQDGPCIESFHVEQHLDYNYNPATIQDPRGLTKLRVDGVDLIITIDANMDAVAGGTALTASISLAAPSGKVYKEEARFNGKQARATIKIKDPDLWWTHDLGKQQLHVLTLTLGLDGKEIDVLTRK